MLTTLVRQLVLEVRQSGARPLVLLAGHSPYYEQQKLLSDKVDISFVDVTSPVLAEVIPGGLEAAYFRYNGHWTPKSHQYVSDRIQEHLRSPQSY